MTRAVVLLTVQEAAERLAVSPRTVRARIRAGRLAYVQERPGTAVRIPEDALAAYLASFTRHATALPKPPSRLSPSGAARSAVPGRASDAAVGPLTSTLAGP
jgi:excisionase family DNA binding protein